MLRYAAIWVLLRVLGRLPARVLYALADVGGTCAWYASPRIRAVTLDHMRHACEPHADPRAVARAARGCVRSTGYYWADLARTANQAPDDAFDALEAVDGVEHFFEAYDRGRGLILVSAHLGNPEFLIRAVGRLGFETLVLTERLEPPRLNDLVHEVRAAPGVRFMPTDRAGARAAFEQLRAGKIVGLLVDRDVIGSGRVQPFFGERTRMPTGAVDLALRTGAPIVTGFARRTGSGRMRVTLDPPLCLAPGGDRETDVAAGMRLLTRRLEDGIRRSPEQWFVLSPVWGGLTN